APERTRQSAGNESEGAALGWHDSNVAYRRVESLNSALHPNERPGILIVEHAWRAMLGGRVKRQLRDAPATVNSGSLMSGEPQIFPHSEPSAEPAVETGEEIRNAAPVWLQRLSLFVLVLFCVYLGILVLLLPWWHQMWDRNMFILARPWLAAILHNGAVRGI